MSVATFRAELAQVLGDIDDVRCNPNGYMSDQVNPPEALIDYEVNGAITFNRGAVEHLFHVMLFHGRTSERAAQKFYDRHRDPQDASSLWRAIEDHDYTHAHYARVTNASQVQAIQVGSTQYLMVDFTVEVVL